MQLTVKTKRRNNLWTVNDMGASIEKGNFKSYLEAYCSCYGVSEEIAMTHRIIQDVKAYYETEESISRN